VAVKDERHALAATLAAEAKATRKTGFDDIKHALTEPRVLVLGLICFCGAVGLYGLGFWLPQVLKTFGLSSLAIGFLTAIPYLVASTGMVLWSWHSDATSERAWHIALPLLLAAAAFVWAAAGGGLIVTMIALTLAALGVSSPRTVRSGPSPRRSSPGRGRRRALRSSTRSAISAAW
jgi:ACS family tartrate transporter-like MFS transporter